MSPRQRELQDTLPQPVEFDPTLAAREEAEAAAEQARQNVQEVDPPGIGPEDIDTGPGLPTPEILTLIELEKIGENMENLQGATAAMALQAADDYLQGATIVLGMGYTGDVQMMTLRILQLYREITGKR